MSILAEHEAPKGAEEQGTENYNPSDKEREALALVRRLFTKCKTHRGLYDGDWINFYHFFRGKQWDKMRPSYRHSEVINMVFQNIQSMMPLLTDSSPKIEFLPQEPSDRPIADIMNAVAEFDWTSGKWGHQEAEVILDGHIYGTGHSSMRYNPETQRIEYQSEETVYCYPDPEARDVNTDCDYFFKVTPKDIEKVRAAYPEFAKFIKSDLDDLLNGSKNDLKPLKFKSPQDTHTIQEGPSMQDAATKTKCLEIEAHIYDKGIYTEQKGDVVEHKLKYPKGRCIKIASDVVLKDDHNPYDHGEIPYQRFVNYILPREYWGMSEVEQLKGPQKIFNKLVSFALDVLTLCGAPVWIVDTTSGIDTDNLVTRPGMTIEKEPGSEVRMEAGVQLQPWVMQLTDRMKDWFDQVGGSQDVTRGANPSGVTAASAITALQEAAQTRIRQKAKNLEAYLQDVGRQYKSLVLQFYTAPRLYRLTNNQGVNQYFKMHIEHADDGQGNQKKYFNIEHIDPMTGLSGGLNKYQLSADLDVVATMGSSLPFNKENKRRELLEYFDRGIVDAEEVLKGVDYPNREAVLQRVKEQQAQQAAQSGKPAA